MFTAEDVNANALLCALFMIIPMSYKILMRSSENLLSSKPYASLLWFTAILSAFPLLIFSRFGVASLFSFSSITATISLKPLLYGSIFHTSFHQRSPTVIPMGLYWEMKFQIWDFYHRWVRPFFGAICDPRNWVVVWIRHFEMFNAATILVLILYGLLHPGYWMGLEGAWGAKHSFERP